MVTSAQYAEVQEEFSPHHYRTEIPNIVESALTDVYERSLYMHLKRRAGDSGKCISSKTTMAEATGMSPRKLQEVKKSLSMPRKELGNRPLIRITQRTTESGDRDTDLITIVNMWDLNYANCFTNAKSNMGGGEPGAWGVEHEMPDGGARDAYKEEPSKKNYDYDYESDDNKIFYQTPKGERKSIEESELRKEMAGQDREKIDQVISYLKEKVRRVSNIQTYLKTCIKNFNRRRRHDKRKRKDTSRENNQGASPGMRDIGRGWYVRDEDTSGLYSPVS